MIQINNITPAQDILTELENIQSFLEESYTADNPAACEARGTMLEVHIARSGKLVADAKYWKDQFTNSAIVTTLKEALDNWSTTIINKKVEALTKDYNYLVNWAERVNKTATHQLDFIRTLISKHKEEMRLGMSR